jgi:hypothetical protein
MITRMTRNMLHRRLRAWRLATYHKQQIRRIHASFLRRRLHAWMDLCRAIQWRHKRQRATTLMRWRNEALWHRWNRMVVNRQAQFSHQLMMESLNHWRSTYRLQHHRRMQADHIWSTRLLCNAWRIMIQSWRLLRGRAMARWARAIEWRNKRLLLGQSRR